MRKFLITLLHQHPDQGASYSYGNIVMELDLHNFNLKKLFNIAAKEFGWKAEHIVITSMCDITPTAEVKHAGTN
ncbi:hypothetical protein IACHDJAJ_00032 [Aeromonas phage vB_AdhS_TS3]|nr:hypothetical protein IACHDJAJ_00032 [Aeromonas phage vB_AdhS_TS3]